MDKDIKKLIKKLKKKKPANFDQMLLIGAIGLAIIAIVVFGYIDYRAKHKTDIPEIPEEVSQEEPQEEPRDNQKEFQEESPQEEPNEPQEFRGPGSDIVIYDIDDKIGSEVTALIAWRTNKRTAGDFIEYGLSNGVYTSKIFSENSDSALYHLVNLIGLKPNTTYHYRITSVDSKGNKTTAPDKTFKTIYRDYNFIGSLDFVTTKEPDQVWLISKDQAKRTFSLGTYKLYLEKNTFLKVPKIWIMFQSEALSDRDDKMYGLEDAYLSKIFLRKDLEVKEVKLGRTGEHMFIELADHPFGNLDPSEDEFDFEFEILIELGCNNFQKGKCLDNKGKPLDYINNTNIQAHIRIFATSFESFTKDILANAAFEYK